MYTCFYSHCIDMKKYVIICVRRCGVTRFSIPRYDLNLTLLGKKDVKL